MSYAKHVLSLVPEGLCFWFPKFIIFLKLHLGSNRVISVILTPVWRGLGKYRKYLFLRIIKATSPLF